MKKVYLNLFLIALILKLGSLKAQDFDHLNADQKLAVDIESCEKGQQASCYKVALWYKNNQKLGGVELAKNKSIIESLVAKRKELVKKDPEATLDEDDQNKLNIARAIFNPERQKKIANDNYLRMIDSACRNGEKAACNEKEGKNDGSSTGLLYYSSLFLIGLAVFIVAKTIFQDEEIFQAQEKLDDQGPNSELAKHGIILRFSRPFFKRFFTPIVSGMRNKKKFKEKYRRTLASAGLTNILTPEDFFAFKLFLIIGFPIIFILLKLFLEADWGLSWVPILAAGGFFYPDLWIIGKIQDRQKEVIMNMPFCVDMLALSVEAGLDFVAAMAKVIDKAKRNALTEEFENLIREIRVGSSRADGLRNLAWRIDLIQVSSFCATLIAADSVGASIGPILKSLATEIRQKKSSEVEKAGATAATKILFPMLFLIVPAVIVIVFAPIAMEFLSGR